MNRKVNTVFSLVSKNQNTIQLKNQMKYMDPSQGNRLFIVRGLKDAVSEITRETNGHIDDSYNWIMYVCSTPDMSSFKYLEELSKVYKKLKNFKINVLFITVGIKSEKKIKKLHKYLNFNDRTIFLHDPVPSQINDFMHNISKVNNMNDELIYEKF